MSYQIATPSARNDTEEVSVIGPAGIPPYLSLRGAQRRGNPKQVCCHLSHRYYQINSMAEEGMFMDRNYYVYILTNQNNTVLYTGVTNDLKRRVYQHKEKVVEGFTKKYSVDKLVYFEAGSDIQGAIFREKQKKQVQDKKRWI